MWNRYFVPDNVLDEVKFGLPRQKSDQKDRELIARRLERAITAVLFAIVYVEVLYFHV